MRTDYQLLRAQQSLRLNGKFYTADRLDDLITCNTDQPIDLVNNLYLFLKEWFSENPLLKVHTSGSTGTPKELWVGKDQMIQSARITCEFLNLRPGDRALLCMPLRYIAGKMMVVRALVAGLELELRTPSGHPLSGWQEAAPRFAAMIPLQVYNSLQEESSRKVLQEIDTLIIGGGAIDRALEEALKELPNRIYSTYGMTETLSHIALRRLNGPEASPYYRPFPSVRLSLSAEGTLVIDAPLVCDSQLETNDVARLLPDGSFSIVGRKDNIINSGGIKLQIEEIEERLRPLLADPYAITALPDPRLGEALTLLVAGQLPERAHLESLPKYQRPRHLFRVAAIPMTGSSKIDRAACRQLAKVCHANTANIQTK